MSDYDYDEARAELLETPAYDTFESGFFGEVSSDCHDEFVALLKAADAVHGNPSVRREQMAAAAEWLISQAEKRRVQEADAAMDAMEADGIADCAIARFQSRMTA